MSLQDKLKEIDRFVLDKVKESHLPAVSLAVIEDDAVVHKRGFGRRNLQDGSPATPQTLYGIGSITKSFTVLSILQLQEKGKLDVEEEVGRYLDFDVKPGGKPVKIKHLMSHTSGLPALAYAEAVIRKGVGADVEDVPIGDVEDMLTFMEDSRDWAHTEPGERWFYLNEGYVLLGGIIEEVSGMKYIDYVRQNILQPLGMERSFFTREKVEEDHDVAQPYVVDQEGKRHPETYLYGSITSDGGLISNVEDMSRYIRMFLNGGSFQGARIVEKDSLVEMMKPRVDTPAVDFFQPSGDTLEVDFHSSNHPRKYGWGLGINPDFFGKRLVGHGGSVLIATGQMYFLPAEGWGVMLLANGSGYPLSQMAQFALTVLLEEDPDLLDFRQGEVALADFEGVYEAYKGNYRGKVRRTGDLLQFETSSKYFSQKVPLIPEKITPDTSRFFVLRGGSKLPVEFVRDGKGKVELLFERYKLRKVSELAE